MSIAVTVHMLKHENYVGTRTSECSLTSYVIVTTPKWSLVTCGQCLSEQPRCQYCDKPVDEEVQAVFYSSSSQTDHVECVPVSEF